jgi:hypothetical protein
LLLVVTPFLHLFTLFGLCVALATASLYGNTVVATTILVTVLVEDAFFYLFFGGPLKEIMENYYFA